MKGSVRPVELNLAIGKAWLDMAVKKVALYVARAESKSNIADGPSREDLSILYVLKAEYVHPRLPKWAYEVWKWPGA